MKTIKLEAYRKHHNEDCTNAPEWYWEDISPEQAKNYLSLMDRVEVLDEALKNASTLSYVGYKGSFMWEDPNTGEMINYDPEKDMQQGRGHTIITANHICFDIIDSQTGLAFESENINRWELQAITEGILKPERHV